MTRPAHGTGAEVGHTPRNGGDPAQEDILRIIRFLWNRKYRITAIACAFALIGAGYSFLVKPVYKSRVVISPKDASGKGSPAAMLSQLGGLGGIVAGQLGIGGASLERMEILAKSHEVRQEIIKRENLLSYLFPEEVKDTAAQDLLMWDLIYNEFPSRIQVDKDVKRNVVILSASFPDPGVSKSVLEAYLSVLNDRIKSVVRTDSERNIEYLTNQISNTSDPLLREKIQSMISVEMERAMLVHFSSFDILEAPQAPMRRDKPKRKMIVITFLLAGIMFGAAFYTIKSFFPAR